MFRNFFVTTALPYANGPLHIGHIMEYIQADIWVRSMRMSGHKVYFIGADDAHGAPIMLMAKKEGIEPHELVMRYTSERLKYLNGFNIEFDHWHSTASEENRQLCKDIYFRLKKNGFIETRSVQQFYDPVNEFFLSDRYIRGQCPKCYEKNQFGDSCEACGSVYTPSDLIEPYSELTGCTPIMRSSDHLFFKLSDPKCVQFLREWTSGKSLSGSPRLQPEIFSKVQEWLGVENDSLKDWDISRDFPYYGIEIPDNPGKYFYVWLDATIGYLASLKSFCLAKGIDFEALLDPNNAIEQIHFIGKDIVYFHALFFPAILRFSERKTPDSINVHGFVNINNSKMSKSRGNGISPLRYLEIGMNPEWIRYYFASKLSQKCEDINFSSQDFLARINSDLIGKYINIASRTAHFITTYFNNMLQYESETESLINELKTKTECVRTLIQALDYSKAVRKISEYSDQINYYINSCKPWNLSKNGSKTGNYDEKEQLWKICSYSLAYFKALTVMLSPILPELTKQISKDFYRIEHKISWNDAHILPTHISPFKPFMKRVDQKMIEKLFL